MNEHRGIWRAKRVDNGEWVEGYLSKSRNISEKPALLKWCIDYEEKGVTMSCIVDPSTLGECSGLTDDNGNKIFEGDVLSNKLPDPELFLCYYCDEEAGFYAKNVRTHSVYMLGALMDMTLFKLEIIGNIHDNPELIQKGAAE